MKTSLASTVAFVAALGAACASPLAGASGQTAAKSYLVTSINVAGTPGIVPGDSYLKVLRFVGSPGRRISADTWAYSNLRPSLDQAVADGCTTVLVTFSHERVAGIKAVNDPAVRVIAHRIAARRHAHLLVAAAN